MKWGFEDGFASPPDVASAAQTHIEHLENKTVCIFINQLRDKIGVVYGNPETTTGGNALKFYASVRIDIRRVGHQRWRRTTRNTHPRESGEKQGRSPFKRAEFDIMFGEGISKIGEIIDWAWTTALSRKAGSWFSYGDKKIGQGRDAVKELLKNDEAIAGPKSNRKYAKQ